MPVPHIVALNKRTSVQQYTEELRKAGIKYDPMKRFKRILKVWVDDRSKLPSPDRIAVVSKADEFVEGQALPEPEAKGNYDGDVVVLDHAPRFTPQSDDDDFFLIAIFKKLINAILGIFGLDDDDDDKKDKHDPGNNDEQPSDGQQTKEQRISFDINNKKSSDNWGLGRIGRRDNDFDGHWPYKSNYKYGATGDRVDAYVVDSGVDNHPDLEGRINWLFGPKGDDNGHGTHVATTVAGKRFGVAKQAYVHAVRVLGSNGSGSWQTIIDGLDAVLEHHQDKANDKPSVVNMSLGGQASKTGPLAAAVDELIENGVVVVVAAGNDNFDLGRPTDYVPAEVEPAITVGATTLLDSRAGFSNYGEILDIWAPGHSIVAGFPNGQIAALSGTSMASPHVAGAVALMLQGTNKATNRVEAKKTRDVLVEQATDGKITWDDPAQSKSPNRLLFIGHTR